MTSRRRQARAIASILAAGHDLDPDYIERWTAEWEVVDRLDEATRAR